MKKVDIKLLQKYINGFQLVVRNLSPILGMNRESARLTGANDINAG